MLHVAFNAAIGSRSFSEFAVEPFNRGRILQFIGPYAQDIFQIGRVGLTTQRTNVFGDPNAQERFEGFGHITSYACRYAENDCAVAGHSKAHFKHCGMDENGTSLAMGLMQHAIFALKRPISPLIVWVQCSSHEIDILKAVTDPALLAKLNGFRVWPS
jgi:hypothetical protein